MADDTGAIATGEGGINDGANAPDVDQTPVESPVAGGKASDSSGNQVDAAAAGSGGGDAESGGSPAAGDGADADDSDADMGATGDADGAEDATLGTADNPLPKLRRPLSAYFLFAAAKRQEVRASNPGGSLGSEAKLIGALWKSLKPEERAPYEEQHAEEMKVYAAEKQRRKRLGLVSEGDSEAVEAAVAAAEAAIDMTTAPLPKLKRPLSAYFEYVSDVRAQVQATNPNLGLGAMQRIIAKQWKALGDEERQPYLKAAADSKQEYKEEMARRKRLGLRTEGDDKKRGASDNPLDTVFPLARVKKLIKLDKDCKHVSKDAITLTAVATEAFLDNLAREARRCAGPRSTLKHEDFVRAVRKNRAFDFLRRDIKPHTPRAPSASKGEGTAAATGSAAPGAQAITSFFGKARKK